MRFQELPDVLKNPFETLFDNLVTDLREKLGSPYRVVCAECGTELEHSAELDSDFDQRIEIQPCPQCTAAEEEGE